MLWGCHDNDTGFTACHWYNNYGIFLDCRTLQKEKNPFTFYHQLYRKKCTNKNALQRKLQYQVSVKKCRNAREKLKNFRAK